MAKSPAFQLYAQDFLMGTMHFTPAEVGGYIRLLCHQWDKGFVIDNTKFLQSFTGLRNKSLSLVLEKFSRNDAGHYINVKLEEVRDNQEEWRIKSSEGGRKSAEVKRNQRATMLQPPLTNATNHSSTLQSSSSTSNKEIYKESFSLNWDLDKKNFIQDSAWMMMFTSSKNVSPKDLEFLMAYFVRDLELKEDYKTHKEIKRHFTNWFAKTNPNVWELQKNRQGDESRSSSPTETIRERNDRKVLESITGSGATSGR